MSLMNASEIFFSVSGKNLYLAMKRWYMLLWDAYDIFSLIKQEDEKFNHQSDSDVTVARSLWLVV